MHSEQLKTPYVLVSFPFFAAVKPKSLNFFTTSLDLFFLLCLYRLYQFHGFNSPIAPKWISPSAGLFILGQDFYILFFIRHFIWISKTLHINVSEIVLDFPQLSSNKLVSVETEFSCKWSYQ